ncbi:hypothetical protein BN2156_04874 [Mycolicibacterium neworleansense]|uniref:Uncharacterized protein n=1 Tax=Mycolicibacterium neworleansense TaxID=146018 RepID=A0A0H5RWS6_9MYCO|nr:hypothetical protein BN2156_04874 [Mycolicibacterium neworleansense]
MTVPHRNPVYWIGDKPIDYYTPVPHGLARDGDLSSGARSVALYVWSHVGGWELSAVSIAEALGMDRKSVGRALAELDRKRWIAIRSTGKTTREYYAHPARKLTEDEHSDLVPIVDKSCPESGQGVVLKTDMGLYQNGAADMSQNGATKKTIQEEQQEKQQEWDARRETDEFCHLHAGPPQPKVFCQCHERKRVEAAPLDLEEAEYPF